MLAHVRSHGQIAIATASSGTSSLLLRKGRTAHSTFKIPLLITSSSTCNIARGSAVGELIAQASIITIDECTMLHRYVQCTCYKIPVPGSYFNTIKCKRAMLLFRGTIFQIYSTAITMKHI